MSDDIPWDPELDASFDRILREQTETVEQVVQVNREGYDHLLECWIHFMNSGDRLALYHLFTDLVNPLLRQLGEQGVKAGWFKEHKQGETE